MTTGLVQIAPDSTGKSLGNEVVTYPAGTVLTDQNGVQTVTSAPIYLFREHVINADPLDPAGLANVRRALNANRDDAGVVIRIPENTPDLDSIKQLLSSLNDNIQALAFGLTSNQVQAALPLVGGLQPAIVTPTIPRPVVSDVFGRQVILPHTIRELTADQATTFTTTTEATIITAGDSNTFNDVVAIIAVNTSATATRIDIRDQLSTVTSPAGGAVKPLYIPAGDMRGLALGGVLIKQTNAGQAWTVTLGTAVTDVRIWALYVKNRSQ